MKYFRSRQKITVLFLPISITEIKKVGPEFSDFPNILFGGQQGSILGPILFITFITDLLFINNDTDFAGYADDTTHYVCGQNFSEVIIFLESNVTNVFK